MRRTDKPHTIRPRSQPGLAPARVNSPASVRPWDHLATYAASLAMSIEDHETAFLLAGHGHALLFARTDEGIAQAIDWLIRYESTFAVGTVRERGATIGNKCP